MHTNDEFDYQAHYANTKPDPERLKPSLEARQQRQQAHKQRITIRLDQDVLEQFKALAEEEGYQTLINQALREWLTAQSILIGNASLASVPRGMVHNTVRGHLQQLLNYLNEHRSSEDHDARYYVRGSTVDDSSKFQGKTAAEFAPAVHHHDAHYPRQIHYELVPLNAGEQTDVKTFSERPDLVTLNYMPTQASGSVSNVTNVTYFRGEHSPSIHAWITRTPLLGGGNDFVLTVRNGSPVRLFIQVIVYHQD